MRKLKKVVACALIGAMTVSLLACGAKDDDKKSKVEKMEMSNDGKVLRIYCWNIEIQSRFKDYVEADNVIPKGVKVEWVLTPSDDNAYQNKLDAALKEQESKKPEERIDMFLIEADYALKYVDSAYTVDVKEIGVKDEDIKDQYKYTQEIATDSDGKLKGLTWQATPGLFAYRRSIAKAVLGTDDPVKVQEAVSDWDKFNALATKMNADGYKMLSGYDDSYRTFSNNVSAPWVNDKNEVIIDDNLMEWVDQTKEYTDKEYNNKTALWSTEWAADQGPKGKVFGFFYSTWGINFTLLENSLAKAVKNGGKEEVGNGIYGDYAVCSGPQDYYWGGSWLCAAAGTDNKDLVADVMKKLTCDEATMKKITEDTQDYTNNSVAMTALAESDFKSDFLGGQNHIKLFAESAPKIDMSNISKYDQGCNEEFQTAFKDYFDGKVTKEEAEANFYKAVIEKYPNLKKPE